MMPSKFRHSCSTQVIPAAAIEFNALDGDAEKLIKLRRLNF
jgi:hypothetical protein